MTQKRSSWLGKIIFLFFLIGIGALVWWAFQPKPITVEIAEVTRGPYEQVIVEEGKTRIREIYQVASPVPGNLERVELDPGDWVTKNQVLATVDWPNPWQIKAPIQGQILRILRESSGPIERGVPIMEIADPSTLEVMAELLTTEAVQIPKEAPVRIEEWGGCQPLHGKVRLVEPGAFTKVSALGIEEQRVKVIIDLESPPEQCQGLADAYRVMCHIVIFQTDDAVILPVGALFREGKDWKVYQVVHGKAQKTSVKIARHNPEKAMVTEGLKAGDQVIVYPGDQIQEGSLVSPMTF